jgi:hypothetical protein
LAHAARGLGTQTPHQRDAGVRRYLRRIQRLADRLPSPLSALRVALAVFVLAWIFGPYDLRSAVPIWLVFLIALGLELHFFVGALVQAPARRPDRGPQTIDRERYGYVDEMDDGVLAHEADEELWMPYSGDRDEEVDGPSAEVAEPRSGGVVAPAGGMRERPRLWPPVRRLLVGLGVIGALTLFLWVVESRTGWDALDADTRAEAAARFSDEASRIAAKPVTIQCDEAGDYVGVVQHADGAAAIGGDLAFLTPQRCLDLYRLAFEGEVTWSQTARALAVLAHEAWHLRGVRDEGTTECYALQAGVDLGQRLGLSEDTARQMMRQQLVENAGRSRASPEYLVPPDCRDGGRLDLNPEIARFP